MAGRRVWVLEQLCGHRWVPQLSSASRRYALGLLRQGTPYAQSVRRVVPYGPEPRRKVPVDR